MGNHVPIANARNKSWRYSILCTFINRQWRHEQRSRERGIRGGDAALPFPGNFPCLRMWQWDPHGSDHANVAGCTLKYCTAALTSCPGANHSPASRSHRAGSGSALPDTHGCLQLMLDAGSVHRAVRRSYSPVRTLVQCARATRGQINAPCADSDLDETTRSSPFVEV